MSIRWGHSGKDDLRHADEPRAPQHVFVHIMQLLPARLLGGDAERVKPVLREVEVELVMDILGGKRRQASI